MMNHAVMGTSTAFERFHFFGVKIQSIKCMQLEGTNKY